MRHHRTSPDTHHRTRSGGNTDNSIWSSTSRPMPACAQRVSASRQAWRQALLLTLGLVTLAGLVVAAPAAVPASQLPDPTRPPVALQMANAAQDMAQRLKPTEAPEPAPVARLPVLQGVQIGRLGATSALLDGQLLAVGDQLGELKVVAIDRQGVTLRGRQGDQRLTLLSADAKQPAGSINFTRSAGFAPAGQRSAPTSAPPGGPAAPGGPGGQGGPNGEPPADPPQGTPAVRKSMRPAEPPASPNATSPRAEPARPAPPPPATSAHSATGAATAALVTDQTRP